MNMKIALAAAVVALPLVSFGGPAGAATVHNLQTSAHTSNAYDDGETAYMKQMRAYHAPFWQYQPGPGYRQSYGQ